MNKIFFFIVALISFFTYTAHADISISPLKHEITIEPWSSSERIIKIKNDGTEAITLYSSKEDFIAGDETWFPRFIKPEDLPNPELSLTNWIKLENGSLTLAPGEAKEVRFTVQVPTKSDPGGHYWVIFFGPEAQPGAQLAVIQRLWVLLLIDVPGEVKIAGDFKEIEPWVMSGDKFASSEQFDNFPINFSVLFNNSWNTHLKPRGKIELIDENGETLKKIWKEKIISQAGAFIWEKVVDYIPVNETLWNVLPNSDRRFISTWEWFGFNVVNETTWQKEVQFKSLSDYYTQKAAEDQKFIKFYQSVKQRTVTKPITANYDLYFEWKDQVKSEHRGSKVFYVTYEEKYIGFNNIMIGLLLMIIIWIGVYLGVIRPKQKSKNEEELRKKIMEEMSNNK